MTPSNELEIFIFHRITFIGAFNPVLFLLVDVVVVAGCCWLLAVFAAFVSCWQ